MTAPPPNQLLRSAASALLAQAALHGELIKVEWAEEKDRLFRIVLSLLAFGVCLLMSLLLLSAAVLVFSWNTPYRNLLLLLLPGCFCIGTLVACYRLCSLTARGKLAFADTCAEISADLALLRHKLGT